MKKIKLDKQSINNLNEFMEKNELNRYTHRMGKFKIEIEKPKEENPKISMGLFVLLGGLYILMTISTKLHNPQVDIIGKTLFVIVWALLYYAFYKFVQIIYDHHHYYKKSITIEEFPKKEEFYSKFGKGFEKR